MRNFNLVSGALSQFAVGQRRLFGWFILSFHFSFLLHSLVQLFISRPASSRNVKVRFFLCAEMKLGKNVAQCMPSSNPEGKLEYMGQVGQIQDGGRPLSQTIPSIYFLYY